MRDIMIIYSKDLREERKQCDKCEKNEIIAVDYTPCPFDLESNACRIRCWPTLFAAAQDLHTQIIRVPHFFNANAHDTDCHERHNI